MEIRYFRTAWDDVKNSPGWFGKIALLALVNLIPVFGQIVTFGYLYGWAREIAWNVHEPLPARIFGNEDGKLYRRGFFVWLVALLFGIVPSILWMFYEWSAGMLGSSASLYGAQLGVNHPYAAAGVLSAFIAVALGIAALLFSWVGGMRASVYDRLSAGLQMGKIWRMIKCDAHGLAKIFGLMLVYTLVAAAVAFAVFLVVAALCAVALIAAGAGAMSMGAFGSNGGPLLASLIFVAPVAAIVALAGAYAVLYVDTLATVVCTRALGYWTSQFDVPRWRGQDDPMPFETGEPTAAYYVPYTGWGQQPSAYAAQQPQAAAPGAAGAPDAGFEGCAADAAPVGSAPVDAAVWPAGAASTQNAASAPTVPAASAADEAAAALASAAPEEPADAPHETTGSVAGESPQVAAAPDSAEPAEGDVESGKRPQ